MNMAEPESPATEPLVQPKLARFLKERRKLIGGDIREELWEQVENNIVERRRPDTAAERAVQKAFEEAAESVGPVARNRMMRRMERANEGFLKNL